MSGSADQAKIKNRSDISKRCQLLFFFTGNTALSGSLSGSDDCAGKIFIDSGKIFKWKIHPVTVKIDSSKRAVTKKKRRDKT